MDGISSNATLYTKDNAVGNDLVSSRRGRKHKEFADLETAAGGDGQEDRRSRNEFIHDWIK